MCFAKRDLIIMGVKMAGYDKSLILELAATPNRKEYNKARRTFFKQCEKELSEYFTAEVNNIAKRMNELMPSKK